MILVAQSITLGSPDVVIATTNVGHLSRFITKVEGAYVFSNANSCLIISYSRKNNQFAQ